MAVAAMHGCKTTKTKNDEIQRKLADRVGFEPTVGLHLRRFSRPLP